MPIGEHKKTKHKIKCVCGKPFYTDSKIRKYCDECVALSRRRKRPVIMLKGGK